MKKFRAWHDKHGWASKISVYKDGAFDVTCIDTHYKSEVWPDGTPNEFFDAGNDGWVLEQFSGSVDCAGIEIYEGDIIRLNDRLQLPCAMLQEVGDKTVGYVLFDSGMFCFGIPTGNNSVQARNLGMIAPLSIAVVGNIHENRDLLENKP